MYSVWVKLTTKYSDNRKSSGVETEVSAEQTCFNANRRHFAQPYTLVLGGEIASGGEKGIYLLALHRERWDFLGRSDSETTHCKVRSCQENPWGLHRQTGVGKGLRVGSKPEWVCAQFGRYAGGVFVYYEYMAGSPYVYVLFGIYIGGVKGKNKYINKIQLR